MPKVKPLIKNIEAREILDARGYPTLEVKVNLESGVSGRASVPSGLSVGSYEAKEARDRDSRRYLGKGVLLSVAKIKEVISPALAGLDVLDQTKLDAKLLELDGTVNKSNLGANTILSVSLACARAGANSEKEELFVYLQKTFSLPGSNIPIPLFNVFNGGKHADTNLDFQEFLVIPKKATAAEMIREGAEIFHALGVELRNAGYDTDVGAEGGYAPDLDSSIEAIELIMAGGLRAGYDPGKDFNLGIDVGSSVLFEADSGRYVFPLDNSYFTSTNLLGLYDSWLSRYPITYIEDGLAEDDWEAWRELTAELGNRIMIVGDDLFATNSDRLRQGVKERAANSIIIKPNQVGTLTETINCVKLADKHNYNIIMSHRSSETNDDFIVDLAVASGAKYLKAGSLSRGERIAKYNRLMEIEDILNQNGK